MKLSNNEIKELVSRFYPNLEKKELEIFLSICNYQVYRNKKVILKGGRTDKYLFLILKGSARAYSLNEKGHELNCHLRSEGYMFGDARVFGDEPQILNAEAIGETHILKYDIEELESLGFANPKIMNFYIIILKEIISAFSHRIHTFVSMSSKERYLDLIKLNPLYLKSAFDKHIASFLGMKPLTLHRIKKSLKTIK